MIEQQPANIMQRVFDALLETPHQSMAELGFALRYDRRTVAEALRRLRLDRALESACVGGVWRYRLRTDAVRPSDRRGDRINPVVPSQKSNTS